MRSRIFFIYFIEVPHDSWGTSYATFWHIVIVIITVLVFDIEVINEKN